METQKGYLLLEDSTVFPGFRFGAGGEAMGELVFTTAMSGYLETLTDPSYYGQIVMQTFPLIGNYGVIPEDFESASPRLFGYLAREWCEAPSNFRSVGNLDDFLREKGVPGLWGLDTRALTRRVRERGVMNACILNALPEDRSPLLASLRGFRVENAVAAVTSGARYEAYPSKEEAKRHVVLWDFGAKRGILQALTRRGCRVTVMPASAQAADILAEKPDGVMLSNGPGDPAENQGIIREISAVCGKIPLFGICLGHQLLALARGARTEKLPYGHRGANQPVRDQATGRVYITSQNHGYAVRTESLPSCAAESFSNANDGTNEGISYRDIPAFSVQFHPEARGGPKDTEFLFDRFVEMMKG